MKKRIKLIWDFRGAEAQPVAEHHARHLHEFAEREQLHATQSGTERLSEQHCLAFLVVAEADMLRVRDALRPNRGELWED